MAKPKAKKPARRSRSRRSGLGALGLPPGEHLTREMNFADRSKVKIAEMHSALRDNKCTVAFAKLIDGVSFAGMAEAEAEGAGKRSARYAVAAADAMTAFKNTCKFGS